jgi:hypothetical protein
MHPTAHIFCKGRRRSDGCQFIVREALWARRRIPDEDANSPDGRSPPTPCGASLEARHGHEKSRRRIGQDESAFSSATKAKGPGTEESDSPFSLMDGEGSPTRLAVLVAIMTSFWSTMHVFGGKGRRNWVSAEAANEDVSGSCLPSCPLCDTFGEGDDVLVGSRASTRTQACMSASYAGHHGAVGIIELGSISYRWDSGPDGRWQMPGRRRRMGRR